MYLCVIKTNGIINNKKLKEMKNQEFNAARKIQQINSFVANKQYRDAFNIMYRDTLAFRMIEGCFELVNKLMTERTKGNFLHACALFEDSLNSEKYKIDRQRKSAKVREFTEQYKNWHSGYSMGEAVKVVYEGNLIVERDTIKNSKKEYCGKAKRWNSNIKYGSATLFVDLTGNRAKYRVEINEK